MTLPSEILERLRRFEIAVERATDVGYTRQRLWEAIVDYGHTRYEEGIEAGRELEQTKGEGM